MTFAENSFLCRNTVIGHLTQKLCICRGWVRCGAVFIVFLSPVPPGILVCLSVQSSFSGYGNVFLLISIDKRTPVIQLGTFIVCKYQRIVFMGNVPGKFENRIFFFQAKIYIAF